MDKLIFNSAATLKEQGVVRHMLVNETANVSTIGFKRSYDIALRTIKAGGAGFETRYQPQTVSKDVITMTPGPLMATGRPLDVALGGNTVLAVQSASGEQAFTRRGDLRVNARGLLENGAGQVVLGQGGPITVPTGFEVTINPDGAVYARDPAQGGVAAVAPVGQLHLRDASAVQLERRADGLFQVLGQRPGSDIPAAGGKLPELTAGALEGSNVNAVEALTRLMDHARSYEAHIRIIKETKGLDESGATLLRAT